MDLLISDRAKVEISKKVKDVLRAYHIKDYQSEPHHQHQNFAESRYATVKCWVNTILNHTGAPSKLWFLCTVYVCYLLNRIASPALGNIPPLQALTGQTIDISNLTCYTFYQKVIYIQPEQGNQKVERYGY